MFLYLVRQFFFVYQDKILLLLQQPENHHGDSRALTLSNQTHGFFSLQESRFKWLNWVTVLIKADLSFLQLGLVTKMKKKKKLKICQMLYILTERNTWIKKIFDTVL